MACNALVFYGDAGKAGVACIVEHSALTVQYCEQPLVWQACSMLILLLFAWLQYKAVRTYIPYSAWLKLAAIVINISHFKLFQRHHH